MKYVPKLINSHQNNNADNLKKHMSPIETEKKTEYTCHFRSML